MGQVWSPGDRVYLGVVPEGEVWLRQGLTGVVDHVDSLGTVHVHWEPFTVEDAAGLPRVHFDTLRRGVEAHAVEDVLAAACPEVVMEVAGRVRFDCNQGPAGHHGGHSWSSRRKRDDVTPEGTEQHGTD